MTNEELVAIAQKAVMQRNKAEEQCRQLKEENESLLARLNEVSLKYSNLQSDYVKLKVAKAYGWDEKSKREAYLCLTGLIREIDNCLEMLK